MTMPLLLCRLNYKGWLRTLTVPNRSLVEIKEVVFLWNNHLSISKHSVDVVLLRQLKYEVKQCSPCSVYQKTKPPPHFLFSHFGSISFNSVIFETYSKLLTLNIHPCLCELCGQFHVDSWAQQYLDQDKCTSTFRSSKAFAQLTEKTLIGQMQSIPWLLMTLEADRRSEVDIRYSLGNLAADWSYHYKTQENLTVGEGGKKQHKCIRELWSN